jgi:hypothetical protein
MVSAVLIAGIATAGLRCSLSALLPTVTSLHSCKPVFGMTHHRRYSGTRLEARHFGSRTARIETEWDHAEGTALLD